MKKCHFIGIGGIGMSGLAHLLLEREGEVSGSDSSPSPITEQLIHSGAKIVFGHSERNIPPGATVVYSSSIPPDNAEYRQALSLKSPLWHRSDLLAFLMEGYRPLTVAGTHGKTTTTALLAAALHEGKVDPSFAVGGVLPQFGTNARHGKGTYFVAEADESDGSFVKYSSFGAIVTNIGLDHLSHFGSEQNLMRAFHKFLGKVQNPSHLFWCGDDARLVALNPPGVNYGVGEHCALRLLCFRQEGWKIVFDLTFRGKTYSAIEVRLIGKHNAFNAAAVFGLALTLGIEEEAIRRAFQQFQGVKRRCEKKAEFGGVLFLDDYAHHPTEIQKTLRGIREAVRERRLIAVFQPHRYSRSQECLGSYGKIFDEVDKLFVTEIYEAGETPLPGVTHHKILEEIQAASSVPYEEVKRQDLASTIAGIVRPHDVVVTLGAGDVTHVSSEVLERLQQQKVTKIKVGVISGGRSSEHEISLRSAKFVCEALREDYYDVKHFFITKKGQWVSQFFNHRDTETQRSVLKKYPLCLCVSVVKNLLQRFWKTDAPLSQRLLEEIVACDVLCPVLHGSFGEDGTVQGMLEMLGKAYVGCGHRASAISMDKVLAKKLMQMHGISVLPFVSFTKKEWKEDSEQILEKIKQQLRYPIFVKPVHLGSSIGVHKVQNETEMQEAIEAVLHMDTHAMVENGIEARECEFALLGNEDVQVLPPGEVFSKGKIYDYQAKYTPDGMEMSPKADLAPHIAEEGMRLAKAVYQVAGCAGMARIDFFLDVQEKFWFNEINPIPGCTPTSLYPQICEANGIPPHALVDKLIILGLQRKRIQERVSF